MNFHMPTMMSSKLDIYRNTEKTILSGLANISDKKIIKYDIMKKMSNHENNIV